MVYNILFYQWFWSCFLDYKVLKNQLQSSNIRRSSHIFIIKTISKLGNRNPSLIIEFILKVFSYSLNLFNNFTRKLKNNVSISKKRARQIFCKLNKRSTLKDLFTQDKIVSVPSFKRTLYEYKCEYQRWNEQWKHN